MRSPIDLQTPRSLRRQLGHFLWVGCLLCSAAWAQTAPTAKELLAKPPEQQEQVLAGLLQAREHKTLLALASALAAKNPALSQFYTGQIWLEGLGVKPDLIKGQKLVLQAAANGLGQAQAYAGLAYLAGKPGFEKNDASGIKYLNACAGQFGEATWVLAQAYELGQHGVAADKARALELYKTLVSDSYAAQAKPRIEALELDLKNLARAREIAAQPLEQQEAFFGNLYFTQKDFATIHAVGTLVADLGSRVAQHYVGMAHWFGRGVSASFPNGAPYLDQCAASGDHECERMAGRAALYGNAGFALDKTKAVRYLQGCLEVNSYCANDIAVSYENGWGGLPKDKARAYAIYQKVSANTQFPELTNVKAKLKELEPLPSSGVKPLLMERKTALGLEFEALLKQQQYAEALAKAQPLAEQNDPDALYALFLLYYEGHGVAKDSARSDAYLSRAAAAGHIGAMGIEGYRHALNGPDLAKGLRYLKAAADGGNVDAMESLRDLYERGYSNSVPRNFSQARHYALRTYETRELRDGNSTEEWPVKDLAKAKAAAKRLAAVDPAADSQGLFVKVMQAAKAVGVRVGNVRTEGSSYLGDGSMTVNGNINVGFSAELIIRDDQLPQLYLQFSSSDRRVHEPLRKLYLDALKSETGSSDLRRVFSANSTMFTAWAN